MAKKTAVAALLVLFSLTGASYAASIDITADRMEKTGSVYNAAGSVTVRRGEATLRAGSAFFDENTSEVSIEGDLFYEDPEVTIGAKRAFLNLDAEAGFLYGAEMFVKRENYHIRSEVAEKKAGDRYILRRASFTTCDGLPPAWCVRAKEADITLGDSITARRASIRIRGVPVFYTPYFRAGMLTERKTGLLPPTLGYRDSTGPYLGQPFYWAIAENHDATLYLDIYPERALGEGVEYRYLTRGSSGSLNLYRLYDDELEREYLKLGAEHRQATGAFRDYLYLDLLNRREYFRLYEPSLASSSRRFLQSTGEVSASTGRARFYAYGKYLLDLAEGADQSAVAQRLPEAGFFLSPLRLGPLVLTSAASAANFEREEGASGRRYDVNLNLSHATGKGQVLFQSLSARETIYSLDGGDLDRGVIDYNAVLRGRGQRRFGEVSHVAEASVGYRLTSPGEGAPPLFDGLELIPETSRAELSLLNRLIDEGGEFVTLRASGGYEFLNGEKKFLPLAVDLSAGGAGRPVSARASASYDLYDLRLEAMNSELRADGAAAGIAGFYLTAAQSFDRLSDIARYSLGLGYSRRAVSVSTGLQYDAGLDEVREVSGKLGYVRQCWGVAVSVVSRPDDFGVFFNVALRGLGSLESIAAMP